MMSLNVFALGLSSSEPENDKEEVDPKIENISKYPKMIKKKTINPADQNIPIQNKSRNKAHDFIRKSETVK